MNERGDDAATYVDARTFFGEGVLYRLTLQR